MKDTVKNILISVVISFTVPTLVVASQWGGVKANQTEIMKQLEKLDGKLDKVTDRVNSTREEVATLKALSSS